MQQATGVEGGGQEGSLKGEQEAGHECKQDGGQHAQQCGWQASEREGIRVGEKKQERGVEQDEEADLLAAMREVMGSARPKQFCVRATASIGLLSRLGVAVSPSLTDVCLMASVMQPDSSRQPLLHEMLAAHDVTKELAAAKQGCTAHESCCLEAVQERGCELVRGV